MDIINTCLATTGDYRLLALYSHLIPAIAIFVLGLFAFVRAHDRAKALYFFAFTGTFSLWLVFDLLVWTLNDYNLVAAFWEPLDYIEIISFLLLFAFILSYLFPKQLPDWLNPALLLSALPAFFISVSGSAVHEMSQSVCEMVGNDALAQIKLWLEAILLLITLILGFYMVVVKKNTAQVRMGFALVVFPVVVFMGIFSGTEYIATLTDVFEINLYALFTLPLLVLLLTIAITSYQTFRLGDTAVRTLFYIFLILAATQFFYVSDVTEFLLAAMSFVVILVLGFMLFRSTEREIAARQQVEMLNRQQENLLHFISHEVKGYLTKGQAAFASIVEGDFGEVKSGLLTMAKNGLADARKGVDTVMNILDASNLKKGTITYEKTKVSLEEIINTVLKDLLPVAEAKGLSMEFSKSDGPFDLEGDQEKLGRHVVRNLIDNAIRYTPTGVVNVALERAGNTVRFVVKDSGVGITPEDMANLFTEGGKGKESVKVNVDSTGYGLFVAKQVVEAHGGKIWAESEGKGMGSQFVVELPLT